MVDEKRENESTPSPVANIRVFFVRFIKIAIDEQTRIRNSKLQASEQILIVRNMFR